MMVIENKFEFGQIVYLKTDINQSPRIVTSFKVTPDGIVYCLQSGTVETWHYSLEISEEKDILVKVNND